MCTGILCWNDNLNVVLGFLCRIVQSLTSITSHIHMCSGNKLNPIIAAESWTSLTSLHPTHITVLQKQKTLSQILKAKVKCISSIIVCQIHVVSHFQFTPNLVVVFPSIAKYYSGCMVLLTKVYWNAQLAMYRHIENLVCKTIKAVWKFQHARLVEYKMVYHLLPWLVYSV